MSSQLVLYSTSNFFSQYMNNYAMPIFFQNFIFKKSPRYEFLCYYNDLIHFADQQSLSCNNLTTKNKKAEILCAPPLSVWPHLFRGAGHEKRRGEQLKWSLTFRQYIGSFPCAQLPGPVHTARLGRVFFCVFSLRLCFVYSFVLFDLFVCPHSFMFP